MTTYMVSFGAMYRTEAHPVLGWWPALADGVLTVEADDEANARQKIHAAIGPAWCWLYTEESPPSWGPPDLGPLLAAVADPKPTSWTVGCSVTVNADGTLELNLEDVPDDLLDECAPPELVAQVADRMTEMRATVHWVKR